ncbi:MAG: ABC transporter [Pseudomonadota bacterium]
MNMRMILRAGLAAGLTASLAACVNVGIGGGSGDPVSSLLTLRADRAAPTGALASAGGEEGARAIAVLIPETPAKLDVLRVPVAVSETEIAYLQQATWVEKPARLFRRLLGETLRAQTGALVLDSDDTPLLAGKIVRGTLREMGYDATTSSVVVQYDAVVSIPDGEVIARRFEARESGILAEPGAVGDALNRTANTVAGEVAAWVAEAG